MCLICVEFQKGRLSVEEGWKNLSEMAEGLTEQHAEEVEEMLWDAWSLEKNKELPPPEQDDDWYWDHGQGD